MMKLTWCGHACFVLEADGYKIAIDPYTGVEGYPELHIEAHEVYCSHQHFDHNAVGQVKILDKASSPFEIREIPAFHDDNGGALRGKNMIRVFSANNVSAAHLGDLGHQLNAAQLQAIGQVDAVLVPVGGVYTLDAAGAKKVCDAIGSRCVIPMHYYQKPYGLPNLATVEPFLKLWDKSSVQRKNMPVLTLEQQTSGVIVLSYPA